MKKSKATAAIARRTGAEVMGAGWSRLRRTLRGQPKYRVDVAGGSTVVRVAASALGRVYLRAIRLKPWKYPVKNKNASQGH